MKSLSNMIKAYTVRYEEDMKKTIDTHLRMEKEIQARRRLAIAELSDQGAFIEGLQATVVEENPSQEEITAKSAKLLEQAKAEADSILEEARKEAEQIKIDAYSAAQKKGYEDGMLQSAQETKKWKDEFEKKSKSLKSEYDQMIAALEPQIADLIASLVEKITGILVKDQEEVILFLVERALRNMDQSDEYSIRVSKEDYEYVALRKNTLINALDREVSLNILEDAGLKQNQCLIETKSRVINCSLDVQLNNLIKDIKLISGI